MKQWITFLLALVMVFSLCACGKSSDDSDDNDEEEREGVVSTERRFDCWNIDFYFGSERLIYGEDYYVSADSKNALKNPYTDSCTLTIDPEGSVWFTYMGKTYTGTYVAGGVEWEGTAPVPWVDSYYYKTELDIADESEVGCEMKIHFKMKDAENVDAYFAFKFA